MICRGNPREDVFRSCIYFHEINPFARNINTWHNQPIPNLIRFAKPKQESPKLLPSLSSTSNPPLCVQKQELIVQREWNSV